MTRTNNLIFSCLLLLRNVTIIVHSNNIEEAWKLFHTHSIYRKRAAKFKSTVKSDARRLRIMYDTDPYAEILLAEEAKSFHNEVSGISFDEETLVSPLSVGELPEPYTRLPCLRMAQFTTGTANILLRRLPPVSIGPMVLDLRGNPGGSLQGALQSASLFLFPGSRVAWVSECGDSFDLELNTDPETPRHSRPFLFLSRHRRRRSDWQASSFEDAPLYILVDEGTASAAELFAGALQDHGRAIVVASPKRSSCRLPLRRSNSSCTAKKGSIQTPLRLSGGGALLVTTHRFATPKQRRVIDREGLRAGAVLPSIDRRAPRGKVPTAESTTTTTTTTSSSRAVR